MINMINMRKLSFLFAVAMAVGWSQQQPPVTPTAPCVIPFFINSTGTGANGHFQPSTVGFDNRQSGCSNWSLQYSSTGYTVVSIRLESAPPGSNVAPGSPGTYVIFAGTVASGSNPSTATTQAAATFSGYFPWIRVNATTLTGTGVVVGVLIGTQPIPVVGGGTSAGGCPGTVGTPCIVAGPDAIGSAPTKNPVQIGGQDTNTLGITQIQTDSNGGLLLGISGNSPQGPGNGSSFNMVAVPGGIFNATVQAVQYMQNGSAGTFGPVFTCDSKASITLTTSGLTRIITGTAAKKIRICSMPFSLASAADIQIVEGTQTTTPCDTGATNMTGLFRNVVGFDPNWSNYNPLIESTNADDVCISMSANVNGGGVVNYAVF